MSWFRLCIAWTVIGIIFLSISACSPKKRVHSAYDTKRYITEHDLRTLPKTNIPVVVNERVVAWMEYFQGPGRHHFKRYLERSSRYLPLMKAILREQGMPTDLVYIALIESGFNNHAYSRAAAVGPWQFIRSTGNRYGLSVDGWIDERRDPIRSTYAAASFFRDLFREYGDWYLAMVGYNAGPGRVAKAIEVTGSRDFWVMAEHRKALKAETRDYVPKFIAAMIMAKEPEKFGFTDLNFQEPWEHESSEVETQTDITVIAKCAGVPEQQISELNPHLIRGATPPNHRNYKIRLPKGTTQKFVLAYAQVPEDERIQIVRHKVQRGDTMYKIARRYGISTTALARANGLSRKSRLHRGRTLIIPVGSSAARFAEAYDEPSEGSTRASLIRYKVRKGDTLSTIAAKYRGVTVSKLRRWNHLGHRSHIRAGQRLKIYTNERYASRSSSDVGEGKPNWHRIRKGETLGSIAARYGTTTKKLMALNNIENPRAIRAGAKIKIHGESPSRSPSIESSATTPTPTSTSIYVVKAGDTPGAIAAKHGMSTKKLMAMNGIKNPRHIRVGQKLKISGSSEAEPSSKKSTTITLKDTTAPSTNYSTAKANTHQVRKGETLGAIAAKYGVSTKQLMSWNGIKNPRRVRAGQKLVIKNSTETQPKTESAPSIKPVSNDAPVELSVPKTTAQKKTVTHKVRSGETLWDIARKHSVTIAQLQKWNNLNDPSSVRSGTTLKIFKN